MDFWRRSARVSRSEKIRNEVIKDRVNEKNLIVDFIQTKKITMVWTHEKNGTEKIVKESYRIDSTRKKEKRKTTYHLVKRNSDYIEAKRN